MLTLKKRADCCKEKIIERVQLEYSTDQGDTWNKYENGKFLATGQQPGDDPEMERNIKIDPPMQGNTFRVHIDASQ